MRAGMSGCSKRPRPSRLDVETSQTERLECPPSGLHSSYCKCIDGGSARSSAEACVRYRTCVHAPYLRYRDTLPTSIYCKHTSC